MKPENKSRSPLFLGWEAAKANAVPALIIQGAMLALLIAYYSSGAVAVALEAHGVGMTQALSTGLAFHAVETAVSLLYGLVGLASRAHVGSTGTRRLVLVGAAASACVFVAAAAGATFLTDLV